MPVEQPCLRSLRLFPAVVVLLQAVGVAGLYYFSGHETESDIYGLLYFDWSWPETLAQWIDDCGTLGTLGGAILILLGTRLLDRSSPTRKASVKQRGLRVMLVTTCSLIALWMLALAATQMVRGGAFVEYALGEHAVRFAVPCALGLLLMTPSVAPGCSLSKLAIRVLVLATAATSLVHGYKAWCLYGQFLDLILLSSVNWTPWPLSQRSAELVLQSIGVLDVVAALLLLGTRWRSVAIYMAAWGFITACSRLTAMGWEAWPETLVRTANWGAPLALVLYDHWTRRASRRVLVSANSNAVPSITPWTPDPPS